MRELALPWIAVSPGRNLQGGEMFGLPGLDGVGKTPTLRMLRTLLPISSGRSSQAMTTTRGRKRRCGTPYQGPFGRKAEKTYGT